MKIETLTIEELKSLYYTRMQEDFPPSELRPFSSMEHLLRQGNYRCFAYREKEDIAAYALLAVGEGLALLDYLAVAPSLRGLGAGTRFLSELKTMDLGAPYLLIEVESTESARDQEQLQERERRIRFYQHSGCRAAGVYSHLFGVEYQILALPLNGAELPCPREIKSALESLYQMIVPPVLRETKGTFEQVCRCFLRSPSEDPPRDFARELGRAVTCLQRSRRKFLGERLRDYGLTGAMSTILLHVDRHPGATQDSIATHMYIDKCNVARRTKKLEELGCLRRETDQADRRQNNLYLTEKGAGLLPVIRESLSQWGKETAAPLTEEERASLLSLLFKMTGQGEL